MGIAVVGTLTSLIIRRTPIARPGLPFTPGASLSARRRGGCSAADRPLYHVLLISSLFWFLGGVIQPAVNAFGKLQIHYGDARTSALVVCMAMGIMVGCLWAGRASRGAIRFGFVTLGAWGIVGCLSALAWIGAGQRHRCRGRAGLVAERVGGGGFPALKTAIGATEELAKVVPARIVRRRAGAAGWI